MSSEGSSNQDTVQLNIVPATTADVEANDTQPEANTFEDGSNGVNQEI